MFAKVSAIVLSLFVLANSGICSPLLFKVTKVIDSPDYIELGVFDATRFRQVRIGINMISTKRGASKAQEFAQFELNAAKRELDRNKQLLNNGIIARSEFDVAQERYDAAVKNLESGGAVIESQFEVVGVVDSEEVSLFSPLSEKIASRSFVLDTPPGIIRLKAKGKGSFSIYIWGTL